MYVCNKFSEEENLKMLSPEPEEHHHRRLQTSNTLHTEGLEIREDWDILIF